MENPPAALNQNARIGGHWLGCWSLISVFPHDPDLMLDLEVVQCLVLLLKRLVQGLDHLLDPFKVLANGRQHLADGALHKNAANEPIASSPRVEPADGVYHQPVLISLNLQFANLLSDLVALGAHRLELADDALLLWVRFHLPLDVLHTP